MNKETRYWADELRLVVSSTLQAHGDQQLRDAFNEKGLNHISQLPLQNYKDLLPILQWTTSITSASSGIYRREQGQKLYSV